MAFIPALFNPSKGAGFEAQQANVLNPTTVDQANQTFNQSQDAIARQKAFADAINASGGVGNLQSVYQQMQGVANGTGPNPAQAQLAQATGANVAGTNAAIAGSRGAGANAGLIARQGAQAGGNIQQQAAGQAATLQANQSLGALNNLGNIAGQQVATQQAANQGLTAATQGEQGQILGSIQGQNSANVGNASQANTANSAVAVKNAGAQAGILGSLAKGVGGILGLAGGGEVPAPAAPIPAPIMAAPSVATPSPALPPSGPTSFLGRAMSGLAAPQEPEAAGPSEVGNLAGNLIGRGIMAGGQAAVNALGVVPMANGGRVMKAGGPVPGQAKVKGDSYANDTVNAKLSPGEIVVPRSVMQSSDPVNNAAKFVAAILAQKGRLPR